MSIILGIDPGSRITGYGVIRQQGRHLQYLGSGCIRTSEKNCQVGLSKSMPALRKSSPSFNQTYLQLSKCSWRKMPILL